MGGKFWAAPTGYSRSGGADGVSGCSSFLRWSGRGRGRLRVRRPGRFRDRVLGRRRFVSNAISLSTGVTRKVAGK